ncbi:hypothetical protein EJ08DRAFT_726694, partial [Tothia fuscella]
SNLNFYIIACPPFLHTILFHKHIRYHTSIIYPQSQSTIIATQHTIQTTSKPHSQLFKIHQTKHLRKQLFNSQTNQNHAFSFPQPSPRSLPTTRATARHHRVNTRTLGKHFDRNYYWYRKYSPRSSRESPESRIQQLPRRRIPGSWPWSKSRRPRTKYQ